MTIMEELLLNKLRECKTLYTILYLCLASTSVPLTLAVHWVIYVKAFCTARSVHKHVNFPVEKIYNNGKNNK